MKKTHIIALVFIAVLVGVLISMLGDFSRYETFDSTYAKKGKEINVVGVLDTSTPMIYEPLKDPNKFIFYLKDEKGGVKEVLYKGEKPRDFERSEKIVITGKLEGEQFVASKILMKCPSKYVEDQVQTASL
ncbi:MAG: cytochrome c maturation protein CcmE [Chitinophagales bacterium]|nr:cytochrome c maturation protein CcmE [Chitinophagales bacterium]MCZ2394373.1 cytochrome c maturation protein CcmE [Chitinophagales bacterium]